MNFVYLHIFIPVFIFLDACTPTSANCPDPDSIDKLIHTFPETYEKGEQIIYTCSRGYAKDEGSGVSTCVESGGDLVWTRPTLTCLPIICPQPPLIDNGRTQGTDYSFGQSVVYKCNDGYKLNSPSGNDEVVCGAEGKWFGDIPTCEEMVVVECPPLPSLRKGGASSNSRTVGTVVTFTCSYGHKLIGTSEIVCQPDGSWSHQLPVCDEIECPNPDSDEFKLKHKDVETEIKIGISFGHKVIFKCNDGGKEIESECTSKGEWDPPPPDCTKGQPSSPKTTVTVITEGPEVDSETPPPGSEGQDGLPMSVFIIVAVVVGVLVTILVGVFIWTRLRKNSYRSADKEKAEAELDSLANNTAHL